MPTFECLHTTQSSTQNRVPFVMDEGSSYCRSKCCRIPKAALGTVSAPTKDVSDSVAPCTAGFPSAAFGTVSAPAIDVSDSVVPCAAGDYQLMNIIVLYSSPFKGKPHHPLITINAWGFVQLGFHVQKYIILHYLPSGKINIKLLQALKSDFSCK